MSAPPTIVKAFFPKSKILDCQVYGSGLINATFFLTLEHHKENRYILQKVNHYIFKDPIGLMNNIQMANQHLLQKDYPQQLLKPVLKANGDQLHIDESGNYWRMFPFIENSVSYDIVTSPLLAYEAAQTFGEYFLYLSDLDASKMIATIPNFHNTALRLATFEKAVQSDKVNRLTSCQTFIEEVMDYQSIIEALNQLDLPLRVTHNDTKINNVLFDQKCAKGICVIDLDTLMPGTLLFDFGDMVRTFTPEASEEEPDAQKVFARIVYFEALTKGFLEQVSPVLTKIEKDNLLLGAKGIIYEQILRFLTDYLEGDHYYSIKYPKQNLNRAKNQMALLKSIIQQEEDMNAIIEKYI